MTWRAISIRPYLTAREDSRETRADCMRKIAGAEAGRIHLEAVAAAAQEAEAGPDR
jgi:hypothetical protein